jgi:hypothetical protein
MNTAFVIENFRKELMKNIRNEFSVGSRIIGFKRKKEKESQNILVEKIKTDLSNQLEKKGIDITNMQISFRPDTSKVTVYIRGD